MQKALLLTLVFSVFIPSLGIFATEGFLGENPGFDFYSKIDAGTYTIKQKLVTQKLRKSGNFYQFGRRCNFINLIGDATVDEQVLIGIENQNYDKINALLRGKNMTTDEFHSLTTCLAQEYKNLKEDISEEQDAREIVASIGLYADGDKMNSDYDIIYDIERINEIIFSTEIKYNGTKNIARTSLLKLLSGNSPAPLLSSTASILSHIEGGVGNSQGETGSGNEESTLENLLGSSCTNSGVIGIIDIENDESFLDELTSVIYGNASPSGGYTAGNNNANTSSGASKKTSSNDFFHKMSCQPGSMFCIDVKTVPGGNITLVGGKNVSIEGILDTFSKHLLPISESSLAYQKMTNNAGSLPIKNLQLWKSLGGLKIYLGNQPQPTKRNKEEQTEDRDMAELKAIVECGYIHAGLPTDMVRANSIAGQGFAGRASNTDDATKDIRPLGAQESVTTSRLSGCYNEYMQEGRQTYYNSVSTDLTEIQAFTISMIQEIRDIMAIGETLNDVPVSN